MVNFTVDNRHQQKKTPHVLDNIAKKKKKKSKAIQNHLKHLLF